MKPCARWMRLEIRSRSGLDWRRDSRLKLSLISVIRRTMPLPATITVPCSSSAELQLALKEQAKAERELEQEHLKAEVALKRLQEANERFRESVKNLTTDAIGAVTAFGMYGQLIADLGPQTAQFADQELRLNSALDVTKDRIEALERAGRFASVAMSDLNQQLLKLPDVHSSLEGVDTAIH